MSLSGKALEAILELDDKNISNQDGFKPIAEKLNILYKNDELHEKFQDLEDLESYKRASKTNIQQFLIALPQVETTPHYNFRGPTWFQITEGCQLIKPS